MDGSLLAFLGVSALVIMTPGQDTALTIRNTLGGGRRAGLGTAAGVATGQLFWTIATSVGLSAILVTSAPAFAAIRIAGGAYLLWLGFQSLRAAIRGHADVDRAIAPVATGRVRRAWRQGLLSSLGNPKLAVFFTTLLPAFAPAGPTALPVMVGLGLLFAGMTVTWLAGYAAVVARLGNRLRRGPLRRALDAVMGTVLAALGGRLVLERR